MEKLFAYFTVAYRGFYSDKKGTTVGYALLFTTFSAVNILFS